MGRTSVFIALSIAGAIATSGWCIEGAPPAASLPKPVMDPPPAAFLVAPPTVGAPAVTEGGLAPTTPTASLYGGNGCCVYDSITSNFNGTKIPKWSYIWFNAVVNVGGLNGNPGQVTFTDGEITFSAGGIDYRVDLPPSTITFSDTATEASSFFDCSADTWTIVVPSGYTGNVFLSGVGRQYSDGLPGGINPVKVEGTFESPTTGLSFKWKWAAAVYQCFADCEDELGAKPIDGDKMNPFQNSDHAGTPEYFKDCVIGGARGGGGSNWTGSYSGTSTVKCD